MSTTKYDLRGIKMPKHLSLAKQSIISANDNGESIVLTDQELVIKYIPVEAMKKHLRVKIKSEGDSTWKVVISKKKKE